MKATVYLYWQQESWHPEPVLTFWEHKITLKNYVYAGEQEVEFNIDAPSKAEILKANIAKLREEQAVFVLKANEIEQRIRDMLCLESPSKDADHPDGKPF